MEHLDAALRDAVYGLPETEKLELTVPPEVLAALQPAQPQTDVEKLIDSVGARWPVTLVSWTEAIK